MPPSDFWRKRSGFTPYATEGLNQRGAGKYRSNSLDSVSISESSASCDIMLNVGSVAITQAGDNHSYYEHQ